MFQFILNLYESFKNLFRSCQTPSSEPSDEIFTPLSASSEITPRQHKNFLLQRVFEEVVHPTLHDVFTKLIWENKHESETLKEYLFRQECPPSNTVYKRTFGKLHRITIDENPQCDRFNITMYYRSMFLSAAYNSRLKENPSIAEEFRDKLTLIKDIINELLHDLLIVPEERIDKHAQDLISILDDILDLIGDLFDCTIDTDMHKIDVKEGIKCIMEAPLHRNDNTSLYLLSFFILFSFMVNIKLFIANKAAYVNKCLNLHKIYS